MNYAAGQNSNTFNANDTCKRRIVEHALMLNMCNARQAGCSNLQLIDSFCQETGI